MTDWIDIAALDEIPQRGARVVKTRSGCVAGVSDGHRRGLCAGQHLPAQKGPLAEGIVHGTAVTCPLHNWVISLETGLVQGNDEGRVASYRARIKDGRILLDTAFLQARTAA